MEESMRKAGALIEVPSYIKRFQGKQVAVKLGGNGQSDCVAVAPDVSNMVLCRLTGKPFWDIYIAEGETCWRSLLARRCALTRARQTETGWNCMGRTR